MFAGARGSRSDDVMFRAAPAGALCNPVHDLVQRRAWPHRGRGELRVGVVVAADLHGLALHSRELAEDPLLVGFERFRDVAELRLERFVLRLIRERARPIEREIKMAAAIVELADLALRRLVVL